MKKLEGKIPDKYSPRLVEKITEKYTFHHEGLMKPGKKRKKERHED